MNHNAYIIPGLNHYQNYKFWSDKILNAILNYFKLTRKDFFSNLNNRHDEYKFPRHYYAYFMYNKKSNNNNITQQNIGIVIKKDHATVINSFKRISNLYECDKDVKKTVNNLNNIINNN